MVHVNVTCAFYKGICLEIYTVKGEGLGEARAKCKMRGRNG